MTGIVFYHLENSPLERALPALLEKVVERGWKAVVEVGGAERLEALDTTLWTYADDAFLPHGLASEDQAAQQPIVLTNGEDNPNAANVRFFVDGATPKSGGGYERLVFMFNGHDTDAVTRARAAWRALGEANELTYWQQDENGRWSKKG
ncbi:MAG TPA: DNA polymerase III subunit chi [Devosiaceae bacterium]|nr:DNA polymerase III subunit chi [Devosiaceae bacterium]